MDFENLNIDEIIDIVPEEAIEATEDIDLVEYDLVVAVDASHAGLPNRKNVIYVPHRIRESVDSWRPKKLSSLIETHPLPVLVKHDSDSQEIVGYVFDAKYIEDPDLVFDPSQYADEKVIRRIPILKGAEPVGIVRVYHIITSVWAKRAFLEGKFSTVSIGASTDERYCSICGADMLKNPCSHVLRYKYNGKTCYHFIGKLTYNHLAYAAIPADQYTRYVEVKAIPKEKIKLTKFKTSISIPYNQIKYAMTNYEDVMNVANMEDYIIDEFKNNLAEVKHMEDIILAKTLEDRINKILEALDLADKKLTAADRKKLPDSVFCGPNRSFPVPDCLHYRVALAYLHKYKGPGNKEKIRQCIIRRGRKLGCGGLAAKGKKTKDEADEFEVKLDEFLNAQDESFFLPDVEEEKGNTEEKDECTTCNETETKDDFVDDTEYDEVDLKIYDYLNEMVKKIFNEMEELADKKLTAAERKKLPDSVFCGPNRTFPVPDCEHYRIALALLRRYKGPGSKAKIRACIQRRGKKLGCLKKGADDAAKTLEFIEKLEEYLDSLPVELFDRNEKPVKEEETPVTDENPKEKEYEEKIALLEKEIADLRDKVKYYEKELEVAEEAARSYYEEIADYALKYKKFLVDTIIAYRLMLSHDSLKGVDDYNEWYEKKVEELIQKNKTYLLGILDSLREEFIKNYPSLKPEKITDEVKDDDKDKKKSDKSAVNVKHERLKKLLDEI